jgi:hypothetical protein
MGNRVRIEGQLDCIVDMQRGSAVRAALATLDAEYQEQRAQTDAAASEARGQLDRAFRRRMASLVDRTTVRVVAATIDGLDGAESISRHQARTARSAYTARRLARRDGARAAILRSVADTEDAGIIDDATAGSPPVVRHDATGLEPQVELTASDAGSDLGELPLNAGQRPVAPPRRPRIRRTSDASTTDSAAASALWEAQVERALAGIRAGNDADEDAAAPSASDDPAALAPAAHPPAPESSMQ